VIPELGLYDKSRITIYNRWGDIVYETFDYQNDWNGTCQSDFCIGAGDLPEGTYYYHVEAKDISFDGFTTLKR
jgi:gliding motility-associated-like protein